MRACAYDIEILFGIPVGTRGSCRVELGQWIMMYVFAPASKTKFGSGVSLSLSDPLRRMFGEEMDSTYNFNSNPQR